MQLTSNESKLLNIIRQAQDPTTAIIKAVEIITNYLKSI